MIHPVDSLTDLLNNWGQTVTSRQRNHFETKFLKAFFLLSEFIPSSLRLALFLFSLLDGVATPLHYRGEAHKASCYSTIEVITPCIGISIEKFEQRKKTVPRRMNRSKPDDGKYQVKLVCDDQVYIACEQSKPRENARGGGLSLARSREARFARPNRRACAQAKVYSGYLLRVEKNRPFPSSKNFHFQNEAKSKTFLEKGLCLHENKT